MPVALLLFVHRSAFSQILYRRREANMKRETRIMAAIDLSDYSEAIVRYSTRLAAKLNAELLLVNVINQRDLDMIHRAMIGYESFSYPDYLADQEENRESKMRDLVAAVSRDEDAVNCRFLVRNGIPHHELLDVVNTENVDILVVGTKGRSNLTDVVVGSIARKLYRRSIIPLLAIPAGFDKKDPE
jgi:nucleotide-binding universal stress UspA family protein